MEVQELLASLRASGGISEPFEPNYRSLSKPNSQSESRIAKWQKWAEEFRYDYFDDFGAHIVDYSVKFAFVGVREDGLVVGEFHGQAGTHRFFANLDPAKKKNRVGCNCLQSLGTAKCHHTFSFADWLSEMMYATESGIYQLIAAGEFDNVETDLSEYTRLDIKQVQNLIRQQCPAPKKTKNAAVVPDVSMLDEVSTTTSGRLCWNLLGVDGDIYFELRSQQAKKRGFGWTKGKRIHERNVFSVLPLANSNDHKILSRLHEQNHYYSYSLDFPFIETCHSLIGQDNVAINGRPAEVQRYYPEFEYSESDGQCGVYLKTPSKCTIPFRVLKDQGRLAIAIPEHDLILVSEVTPEVGEVIGNLVNLKPMPMVASDQLIEHLKQFQSVVPIDLPTSKSRAIESDTTTPVVLLRSREDGKLDYGIRLRGSLGHLYKPAYGPLVVVAETKKAKNGSKKSSPRKRLRRNPANEVQQTMDLLDTLGLEPGQQEGTLSDFQQAIDLIEVTQQLETENKLEVLWDKSSVEPVRVMGSLTPKNLQVKIGKSRDWLQLQGKAELPFGSLDLEELLRGIESADRVGDYVKFGKKGWAKVSNRLRRQLAKVSDSVHKERKKLHFDATSVPALQKALGNNVAVETSSHWDECVKRMELARNLKPVVPPGLKADLRTYQTEGFEWLRKLAEWRVGGILADDMGLGKTLQALAVVLDRSNEGPSLVVAPTSVGFNWKSEAERFAPQLNVHLYRESNRSELISNVAAGDVVICSYGLMLRDQEILASKEWGTLVLDEAQAIKNSRGKTSIAAKAIPAKWKLALTGTPMENHLGELWSIFHVIAPGVFGGWENFRRRFALPIERDQDESRRLALRDRIQPFVLRRKKSEVLHELPPRNDQTILIELSPEERKAYDAERATALLQADEIAGLTDVKDQRFRLLALLTRLRQLACSPRLLNPEIDKRSSKLERLASTLHQLQAEGHRVLIFSQFVKHLQLIREMLEQEDVSFEYLDGSTPAKARKERVDRFQKGDTTAFLISLKAGGTGLNLTAADYVIHMDPWWNPAVEDQATDRAHRIGQKNSVMCYRFVAEKTIEEEILKLHETKRDLVAGVLEGSSTAAKLSTEDLIKLIRN